MKWRYKDLTKREQFALLKRSFANPARTGIAAVAALLAARLMGSQEAYWAPMTTIIIIQSSVGTALTVAWQRLVGTALGAAAGALVSTWFGTSLIVYAVGVFGIGLLCAALRLDRPAYRFAGITLTIVMFAAHAEPTWWIALHRFCEVSLGIVVGMIALALWPERPEKATMNP